MKVGLFRKKEKKETLSIIEARALGNDERAGRIAALETARSLKQQEIEELLFELGKKSGKSSIYNKKRLKRK